MISNKLFMKVMYMGKDIFEFYPTQLNLLIQYKNESISL